MGNVGSGEKTIERGCTERMDVRVRLVNYCLNRRAGKPGNFCMCDHNLCNSAVSHCGASSSLWACVLLSICILQSVVR